MSDNIKKFVESIANEKFADAKEALGIEFREKLDTKISNARKLLGLKLEGEGEVEVTMKKDKDDDYGEKGKVPQFMKKKEDGEEEEDEEDEETLKKQKDLQKKSNAVPKSS